jgi:hypothetical protein
MVGIKLYLFLLGMEEQGTEGEQQQDSFQDGWIGFDSYNVKGVNIVYYTESACRQSNAGCTGVLLLPV